MHELRHGRVSVPVPSGWTDQSTILVVGPVTEGLEAPLAVRSKSAVYRPSLAVSLQARPPDVDSPQEFLERMLPLAQEQELGIERLPEFALKIGGGDGWVVPRVIDFDGTRVRQLVAVALVEQIAVVVTASLLESRHTQDLPELQAMIEGVRFGPPVKLG